jgi:hypothetical protein
MGHVKENLRLRSKAAEKTLEVVTSLFPGGVWVETKGTVKHSIERWGEAMDTLIKATKNFKDQKGYNETDASIFRKEITRILGKWESNDNKPGDTEKILEAARNSLDKLLKALRDLSELRKGSKQSVKTAIDSFRDGSVTMLKLFAARLENESRQREDSTKWQDYHDTARLMRFQETASELRLLTGDLPPELMRSKEDSAYNYFTYMTKLMSGRSGKHELDEAEELLRKNVNDLENAEKFKRSGSIIKEVLEVQSQLEERRKGIISGDQKAAGEAMVFLQSMSESFEGKLGEQRGKGDHIALPAEQGVRAQLKASFERTAKEAIDHSQRDPRWEEERRRFV